MCHAEDFTIIPNVQVRELTHYDSDDDNALLSLDESKPDDFNALILEFPGIDADVCWSLYQCGISVEEIAATLTQ
jgi:hypothetical protein